MGGRGTFGVVRISLSPDQFIVDVCTQLLKLRASKPGEFIPCSLPGVGLLN